MIDPIDRIANRPQTRFRDYVLQDYEPRADPRLGLHPASLLRAILRERGLLDLSWPILAAIRDHVGSDETVWGAKFSPQGFGLELYFYTYALGPRKRGKKAAGSLRRALEPLLAVKGAVDEASHYFMCSLDLDEEILRRRVAPGFRIYLNGGGRRQIQGGFSFLASSSGCRLENHYWFYRGTSSGAGEVRNRLVASPRSGARSSAVFPPYLADCHTICYAVKPSHDGLYFSRLTGAQVARFLASHGYEPLARAFHGPQSSFSHLRWDIGYDFSKGAPDEAPKIQKIGLYGLL